MWNHRAAESHPKSFQHLDGINPKAISALGHAVITNCEGVCFITLIKLETFLGPSPHTNCKILTVWGYFIALFTSTPVSQARKTNSSYNLANSRSLSTWSWKKKWNYLGIDKPDIQKTFICYIVVIAEIRIQKFVRFSPQSARNHTCSGWNLRHSRFSSWEQSCENSSIESCNLLASEIAFLSSAG